MTAHRVRFEQLGFDIWPLMSGQPERARRRFRSALAHFERAHLRDSAAFCANNLGILALRAGPGDDSASPVVVDRARFTWD